MSRYGSPLYAAAFQDEITKRFQKPKPKSYNPVLSTRQLQLLRWAKHTKTPRKSTGYEDVILHPTREQHTLGINSFIQLKSWELLPPFIYRLHLNGRVSRKSLYQDMKGIVPFVKKIIKQNNRLYYLARTCFIDTVLNHFKG
jgi:hypothetical protein